MKKIFVVSLLWIVLSSQAHAEDHLFELELAPTRLGYSTFDGPIYGMQASLLFRMYDHWQWRAGGSFSSSVKYHDDFFLLFTGPRYNFGEDLLRSYFLGAGVAYGNEFTLAADGYQKINSYSSYFEFGKRFQLNDAGTWSYEPQIAVYGTQGRGNIQLLPLVFTYSF